jgi:short subunit dehydrogenase-like uncharacterized protein
MTSRTPALDLVLYGATGYTGALVAAHLAAHAPEGTRIGLAGRDRRKLEAVRDELARKAPHAAGFELLVADSSDPASLRAMVERTRVIASTVGPYARYGTPLVEAAARAGTDYCDLTGEPPWIRSIVRAFHTLARERGARIVPCSGFDSIPSTSAPRAGGSRPRGTTSSGPRAASAGAPRTACSA